jgi:triosephosphate isomerase
MVAGNWKMNGQLQQVKQLINELNQLDWPSSVDVMVAPPSIYIPLVSSLVNQTIKVGAQNAYPKDTGAFTGELSAPMLKDFNCSYVLIGHSERRHYFHESENFVADKFHHVKDHAMIPVLCVGETLEQREKGQTQEIIARQLAVVAEKNKNCFRNGVIAYEPVWAIGTGITATPEQAQNMHEYIRNFIKEIDHQAAETVTLLYGGSVNEHNAKALFAMPDIDGGLIGAASLNAKQFVEIIKCIN